MRRVSEVDLDVKDEDLEPCRALSRDEKKRRRLAVKEMIAQGARFDEVEK